MNNSRGFGTRQRRLTIVASLAVAFMGLGLALAATPAGRGAATASTPARGTVPNKAAADAQFEKANVLYQAGKYAEAQVENERALALDPGNMQAQLMRQVLQSKLAGGEVPPTRTGGAGAAPGKIPLLTTQQVNLIRAMEATPNDRLTGRFDPKVLEDFWTNVVLKDQFEDKSRAAHDRFVNPNNFQGQLMGIRKSNELK